MRKRYEKTTELTPFAKFFFGLRGYDLYSKRTKLPLDKWEAFDLTDNTVMEIITGKCARIEARKDYNFLIG